MSKMRAYRLLAWGTKGEYVETNVPCPAPGEVLVKMGAVGLCHSDIFLQDALPGVWPFSVPFTLGHENAGWIADTGLGAQLPVGTPVVVSCVHSCGTCAQCLRGRDNYCWWSTRIVPGGGRSVHGTGPSTRGVGLDGGLAEYMIAPEREVVPLTTLEPRNAAILSDAGGTSYHTVKRSLSRLTPGTTAVVIGVGGLGSFAVQYLRLLTSTRIVCVDVAPHRLAFARELGADVTLPSTPSVAEEVMDQTKGEGAEAVLDFVGTDDTLALSAAVAAAAGRITVCGAAGGILNAGWGVLPGGCEFVISFGYTLADLREVLALAEQGKLRIETQTFPFDAVPEAYEKLRSGTALCRVLVEHDLAASG